MLVLKRQVGQSIVIGQSIVVKVLSLNSTSVLIGIEAPRDMRIVREEVQQIAAPPALDGPEALEVQS